MEEIKMEPIGYVKNKVQTRKDVSWGDDISVIELKDEYHTGLKGLNDFSHAIILFYLDKASFDRQKHLNRRPQNNKRSRCFFIMTGFGGKDTEIKYIRR